MTSILKYRNFVMSAVAAEYRARFARSRLGLFWAVLHPLAQALIFAIVLSEVLGARLPGIDSAAAYPVYLLAGLAAWGLFSEIINRMSTVFLDYASALKKISFPRLCLPMIVGCVALINHALLLAAIFIIFLFFGHIAGPEIVALTVGAMIISALAFGIGVFLGVLNVFSRDVGQTLGVVMQILFWMTPIVYPITVVPERFRFLVEANPLTPLVAIYQETLLLQTFPSLDGVAMPIAIAVVMILLSMATFRRASPDLVDAL